MNVRLIVLGLLRERPQHGYELHKWLELSRADIWADVLPGSFYHALRQMHKEGLVAVHSTERVGNRSRAIYSITAAGEEAFERLLHEGWQLSPRSFPTTLYTLLTFSEHFPTAVFRDVLQRQILMLEQALAEWQAGETAKTQAAVLPLWGPAMFENGLSHLEADLRLFRTLLISLSGEATR